MSISLKSKNTEIFTKYKFSKDDTSFISDVLGEIDVRQDNKSEVGKKLFLTQKDKAELIDRIQNVEKSLTKTIYGAGLVQFLAILYPTLAIFNLTIK